MSAVCILFQEDEEGYNDGEVDDEEDEEDVGGMAAFFLSASLAPSVGSGPHRPWGPARG